MKLIPLVAALVLSGAAQAQTYTITPQTSTYGYHSYKITTPGGPSAIIAPATISPGFNTYTVNVQPAPRAPTYFVPPQQWTATSIQALANALAASAQQAPAAPVAPVAPSLYYSNRESQQWPVQQAVAQPAPVKRNNDCPRNSRYFATPGEICE